MYALIGGCEKKGTVDLFLRYCDFVVRALASHAYIFGVWPPQVKSLPKARGVLNNLASAHIKAYHLIHKIYKESQRPRPSVGISQFTQAFAPCTAKPRDRFAAYLRDKWFNFGFIDAISRHNTLNFIGLNYYSRQLVEVKKGGLGNFLF